MINYITTPFKWFFKLEAASGVILLLAAVLTAFAGALIGKKLLKKITTTFVQITVAVMIMLMAIAIGFGVL